MEKKGTNTVTGSKLASPVICGLLPLSNVRWVKEMKCWSKVMVNFDS